ncbi:CheY-like chemotaxis protein [Sinorhizobium fredii]
MEPTVILLAEDEALLRLDFKQALTEVGFDVVAVSTGGEAIARLNAEDSSIRGLITDIRFHESPDGWDVARHAREIDPEMPVVYVSGDSAPIGPRRASRTAS